jgi:hypothetical protein
VVVRGGVRVKKRILAIVVAALIAASLFAVPSSASQIVCFTGVEDTLMPLRDSTMPAYFGTKLYVPATVFANADISSGISVSESNLYVYKGKRRLNFFISLEMVTDQDGVIYDNVPVKIINGLYFLPLDFMCEYFKLTYTIIPSDPASILRIKSSAAVFNDKTFAGHYKKQMADYFSDYTAPPTVAPPTFTPPAPPGQDTPTPPPPTYGDVTVFLSFYAPGAGDAARILNVLSRASARACFFMTAAEIARYPALARRISGEGHSLGIWLETADFDEYAKASRLLFEAAKTVSPLVASPPEISEEVAVLAEERGLVYRACTIYAGDDYTEAAVNGQLPTLPRGVADVRFSCSENTARILPGVLDYLREREYALSLVTETTSAI